MPKSTKIKMKKNANDYFDKYQEKLKDPKYKTELCKSYMSEGICVYGNACRFAHGKQDLLTNDENASKKERECISFFKLGYCTYGTRCCFIHDSKELNKIERKYFSTKLEFYKEGYSNKRLDIFKTLTQHIDEAANNFFLL